MKKTNKIIKINTDSINVKEIIEKGDKATLEERVGAAVVVKYTLDQIAAEKSQAEAIYNLLASSITSVPFGDNLDKLLSSGAISYPASEKPVFEVSDSKGVLATAYINEGNDDQFKIDPALSVKATLDKIVPEQYKKVNITLNKSAVEKDYNAGTLPKPLAVFCSKDPIEITKLIIKATKEEE